MLSTLVDSQTLAAHLDDPDWVVVDCRFILTDPAAGRRAYEKGHIPGASYAHLDEDLSSLVTPVSGRHPLPHPKMLAEKFGAWGIDKTRQVVVYDDSLGAIAARLWWLLRWLGHEAVALLDVGYPKWEHERLPITTDQPVVAPAQFHPTIDDAMWVDTPFMEESVRKSNYLILDARAEERFTGDVEPLDSVAGHIPGAVSAPYEDNLSFSSAFMPPDELRDYYQALLGATALERVIHMCGSGVTACHNILAMEHAGLHGARLYAGSWSEWIRNPEHPIATGGT